MPIVATEKLPGGHELAFEGEKLKVYFICSGGDNYPAKKGIDGLSRKDQVRLFRVAQKLADGGRLHREEYVSFEGDLWELKIHKYRVLGFYYGRGRAFLTHGFKKKTSATTKLKDKKKALELRKLLIRTLGDN